MAIEYVDTGAFVEQASSPRVTTDADNVLDVRRVYRGKISLLANFLTGIIKGTPDAENSQALLLDYTTSEEGRFATVTVHWRGKSAFEETEDSGEWETLRDRSWRLVRVFKGPKADLAGFVAGYSAGDVDFEFGASYLEPDGIRARPRSKGEVEVSLTYRGGGPGGTADFDPDDSTGRTIEVGVGEGSFEVLLGCGMSVTAFYTYDKATVTYTESGQVNSPQYQSDLSDNGNNKITHWSNPDFAPADYPEQLAGLALVSRVADFRSSYVTGADISSVLESHEYVITANANEVSSF